MPPAFFVALGAGPVLAAFLSAIAVTIATTAITTVVGMLLQRKPKKNPLVMDDRTITVRQPLTPRQVIFGGARVGGTIVFLERIPGDDILLGITWAGEEITAIDSIYADDEQIFINPDGTAVSPRLGHIEVYHHLGTDDQLADETFKNLAPKLWTDDHRLRGRAWSAIVIFNLETNWENNIPNFSASVRGRKLYDPRSNTTGYSTNTALAILKFLTDTRYGYGKTVKLSDIDINNFAAEANICDEEIAVPPWSDGFTLQGAMTFTVNTTTDLITFSGGGPNTGDSIYVFSSTTLPAPLATGTQYWIKKTYVPSVYPYIFQRTLHPTLADAQAGTNGIDFTTAGTGTHTAIPTNTKFALTGDTMAFTGNAATDVIVPSKFVWLPAGSKIRFRYVIILETTGSFAANLQQGVKFLWEPTGNTIFQYPNGDTQVVYGAGSTGTFSMRFVTTAVLMNTAAGTNVDSSNDTLDIDGDDSMGPTYTGMPVVLRGTPPSPLVSGNTYYLIKTATTGIVRLAESEAAARQGRYIDILENGSAGTEFLIESANCTLKEVTGLTTGMACEVWEDTLALLPAPLAANTIYYIIRTGHASFSLATTRANAMAGVPIAITAYDSTSGPYNIRLLSEPRYTANGVFDSDQDKGDVLRGLLSACAGKLIPPVGNDKWKLAVGAYRLPMISLSEADAVDGITLQARRPRRDTCNTVKGTFAGPVNYDQPASLPVVTNADYLAEDGGEELAIEVNLPFTDSKFTGVRLLKIELERRRKQMSINFPMTLEKGLQIESVDGVDVSWARFEMVNKSFECSGWKFSIETKGEEEPPLPRITAELIEMGPDVYS